MNIMQKRDWKDRNYEEEKEFSRRTKKKRYLKWKSKARRWGWLKNYTALNYFAAIGLVVNEPVVKYYKDDRWPLMKWRLVIDSYIEDWDLAEEGEFPDDYLNYPTFITCVCWGDKVERNAKWVSKGRVILVEGQLKTRYSLDCEGVPAIERPRGTFIRVSRISYIDRTGLAQDIAVTKSIIERQEREKQKNQGGVPS